MSNNEWEGCWVCKKVLFIIENNDKAVDFRKDLQDQNIEVVTAHSIWEAVNCFISDNYCLIVIDEPFASADDYHLIKAIKKATATPILVLSLQMNTEGRYKAFKAGAHGYLDATYSHEECIAQALSLIQLYSDLVPTDITKHAITFGKELIIDESTRQVFLKGKELILTMKEFEVLHCLASNPGRVFTREQLYDRIWDEQLAFNVDEVVKAHIKTLRQKLSEADKEYIKNVWGVGYRFHHETDE